MANYLIVQRGPEIGRRYNLGDDLTTLGRSADNDIELDDPYVSRYHAAIKKQGNNLVIVDLGSENPVLIRDTPLEPGESYVLQHRDIVRIGQNIFSFINGSMVPPRPAAPAFDAYKAVPPLPASNNAAPASVNQVPYQPVGSGQVVNAYSMQDQSPARPPVEDEGATMVGTNFGAMMNKPKPANEAAVFSNPAPVAPSNPAVSTSSGSFGGDNSITGGGFIPPVPTAQANFDSKPAASQSSHNPAKPNEYSETKGVGQNFVAPPVASTPPVAEDNASTTVVDTSGLGSNPADQSQIDYSQVYTQYGQYGQYDQYNQQYGQPGQPQYGGQSQSQANPYGQYDQSQYQPGQSQSQSGYGQGQQSQSQGQYGQYSQSQPQYSQPQPQTPQYGQYSQPQYGQYGQEQQPYAPENSTPAKKDEKAVEKPIEEYNAEDAPTTIIRIDKSKM